MWLIKLHVMNAIPLMLAKPSKVLSREFPNIKSNMPLWDNNSKKYDSVECCGTAHNIELDILDACRGVKKLITIEAIYIKNRIKPSTSTGGENNY